MKMKLFDKAVDELKQTEKDIQKALDRTVADCKNRAPAQVTKAVTAVYGIKAKDVTEAGKSAKRGAKSAGKIKVQGYSIDNLQLEYKGRLLTPIHFSMSPKTRPDGKKKYKVKATIIKGQRVSLPAGTFIAEGNGGVALPFQRTSDNRMPIEAVRTLSVPQMIDGRARETINETINTQLEKRFDHNIKRAIK